MDEHNEQWEKLISMPEEYEHNPSLAERALAEFDESKAQAKKPWFKAHWKKLVACAASLVLLVGIGIPVYNNLTTPPPVVYYGDTDLVFDDISDVSTFVTEKGLPVRYFDVPRVQAQSGTIKETGKVALLYQKLVYISETGFDKIELNVLLEKNLTLDFQKEYSRFESKVQVEGIEVEYKMSTTNNGLEGIFAKFSYENADYYLEVVTASEPEACIRTYVGMLIG